MARDVKGSGENHRRIEARERGGFLSGLNPLETLVIAAIVLVALGGALLVGKGLMLKSRVDSAASQAQPMMASALYR